MEQEFEIWANILGFIINYCNFSDHSVITEAQFKIRMSHRYFGWHSVRENFLSVRNPLVMSEEYIIWGSILIRWENYKQRCTIPFREMMDLPAAASAFFETLSYDKLT